DGSESEHEIDASAAATPTPSETLVSTAATLSEREGEVPDGGARVVRQLLLGHRADLEVGHGRGAEPHAHDPEPDRRPVGGAAVAGHRLPGPGRAGGEDQAPAHRQAGHRGDDPLHGQLVAVLALAVAVEREAGGDVALVLIVAERGLELFGRSPGVEI